MEVLPLVNGGKQCEVIMFAHFTSQNINQCPLLIPHTTNHVLHHTVTNQMFVIVVEIKKTICSVVKFVCLVLTL